MSRKNTMLPDGHPAEQSKSVQFNLRLSPHQMDRLHAGAAHIGMSVSAYVRWLLDAGTTQVLEGPSKADKLKAANEQLRTLMAPLAKLEPPAPRASPYDPSLPPPDIKPAPLFIPEPPEPKAVSPQTQKLVADVVGLLKERPDASQPLFGPPKGLGSPSPVVTVSEATQTPSGAVYLTLDDLIRASTPKPGVAGPQPMELPDDMDDWV